MKIVHVYKDYYPPVVGGVEKHIAQVCNYFKDKYEVEALVCNHSPVTRIENIDGVTVTRVGQIGRLQSAPLSPAFPLWLRKVEADIFHYHMPNPTCELSHLMTRPRGSVVVTYHSDIIRQKFLLKFYRSFLRRFLSHARIIMPTSPIYAETSEFLKEFQGSCTVVPLGIDTKMFDSVARTMAPEIERVRNMFGAGFILFVGKLRYYKGLQFLIEAMPEITVPLVIIGRGPMEDDLRMLAQNYQVADKVHFVGEVTEEDLAVFYHACSLFVLPSIYRSEAYGLVQLEAHSCGKPVVSTKLGTGVEFVNVDGKTGRTVPPADSKALAGAIKELLADPVGRKRMGEYARQRALKEFTLQRMFDQVEAVYKRALSSES
jgi:rhamnosyl/mannosyltransferase